MGRVHGEQCLRDRAAPLCVRVCVCVCVCGAIVAGALCRW